MSTLLESVPTDKLDAAFKKYLKPVMEGTTTPIQTAAKKQTIVENRSEVTGDRAVKSDPVQTNIVEMRRLAGLVRN